ncbi:hypothetical protein H2203_003114 [Taxawa tesnikishii (nom. ined.)]|nr:hypothetical protein H2203_003114 [Dothideales sp. JES 119]
MSWRAGIEAFKPALPQHCEPATDFLYRFSSTFHVCVPTNLAFISTTLGTLSIVSWLFAQLPQIYKNYSIKSTSGLSIYFLVEWCLGDLSNLLGAILTHQATWQMIVAGYYCFVDLMLVAQWLWYEHLQHGHHLRRVWPRKSRPAGDGEGGMQQVVIEGMPPLSRSSSAPGSTPAPDKQSGTPQTPAKDIKAFNFKRSNTQPDWRTPDFEKPREDRSTRPQIHRIQPSSSIPSPSPRTVIFLACLISLATATPTTTTTTQANPLSTAGTILSWASTALYLLSRLPQLYKNYRRRSTSGLSPHLFLAAFFGNLFYSSSILTNPNAWLDAPPHGNGGWAGADGNARPDWIARATPFFLGAAGALALDAGMGLQFLMYGEARPVAVVDEDELGEGRWRWRRCETLDDVDCV